MKELIKNRRGLQRTNNIVIPDSRTWLNMSNYITTMSSDYSVLQLKIVILIIEKMQMYISKVINNTPFDLFGERESVLINIEYRELGITSNKYTIAREVAMKMITTPVSFDIINPLTGEKAWYCTGLISSVLIPKKKNSRSFSVEIKREIMDVLLNVDKGFTQFIKEIAFNASSKYTIRLYMLISSWKNKGGFSIDMGKFRKWLKLENKYNDYKDLYRRVIRPVYEELFEKSNCWFEVAEVYRDNENQPYKLNFKVIKPALSQKEKEELELKQKNITEMCMTHLCMNTKQTAELKRLVDNGNMNKIITKIVFLGEYVKKHYTEISDVGEYCYTALMKEANTSGLVGDSI